MNKAISAKSLLPKLWDLKKTKPYPYNARTHPPEQIELLAELMKRWGPDQPIVVDEKCVILKGHGRREAAYKAGIAGAYPVVQRLGLPEHEKDAMRLADNQVGLLSGWDNAKVQLAIGNLKLAGYPMELLGFGQSQLVQFETALGPQAGGADPTKSLAERFGIVPFSVFNAREGWWQDRKRAWIALGIESEVGRGENLLKFSDSVALDGAAYKARFTGKKREKKK